MISLLSDVEGDCGLHCHSLEGRQLDVKLTSGVIDGGRGRGVLNIGERAVWSGGGKNRDRVCSLCVTN